jgi:hypothetical protein
MAKLKVSELQRATSINFTDLVYVVQSSTSKAVTVQNLLGLINGNVTVTGKITTNALVANTISIVTINGLVKGNGANVLTAAVAGTDYQSAQSVTGIVKSSGTTRSAATSGTDYAPGTSALATGIIKSANTTGALSIAVAGTDYQSPVSATGILKSSGVSGNISAAVVGTDYQAPLPTQSGQTGKYLTTDGNAISWSTVSGLVSRATVSGTTASLANAATANLSITGYKGYILYKIQTSTNAWVRIYTDTDSRTADASRNELTDPAPSAGVIAEVITSGPQTILISPGALGFNNEASPTTNIPIAVTNKSGNTAAITVTLTVLQLEA